MLTKPIVPVIAVATKFDTFVQGVLQELEEAAEIDGEEIDNEELEAEAETLAKSRFKEYLCTQLNDLPCPPKAIIALSRSTCHSMRELPTTLTYHQPMSPSQMTRA